MCTKCYGRLVESTAHEHDPMDRQPSLIDVLEEINNLDLSKRRQHLEEQVIEVIEGSAQFVHSQQRGTHDEQPLSTEEWGSDGEA